VGHTRTSALHGRRRCRQFTADPREFVDAALTIHEEPEPVLPNAEAWVEVSAVAVETGDDEGTEWERWELSPTDTGTVEREGPRTINRGFYAVVDATVAASRLDVAAFDTDTLLNRLAYFETVVEKTGGPRERAAFETLSAETEWQELAAERDDGNESF
jgi:Uncharacterized conserved protein